MKNLFAWLLVAAALLTGQSHAANTYNILDTPSGGGFVYTGALAGIPATCTVGQIAFITNATPGQNQYNCTSTNTWTQNLNSGSGGASQALDNLAAVNINTALLAQTGVDVGSTTKPFRDLYLFGGGTYGTNYFRFTGTPTSTRVITIPDAAFTIAAVSGNLGTPSALVGTNITGTAASLTAGAATALAANPTDCGADTYATAIAASGNLTCGQVTNAGLAGSITASKLVGSDIATVGTVTTGVWNATDVPLSAGGTGATLADPGADRVLFWDDSAGVIDWLIMGSNLSITDKTLNATGGGGSGCTPGGSAGDILQDDGAGGCEPSGITMTAGDADFPGAATFVGDVTAPNLLVAGTLTDGALCVYESTGTEIICDTATSTFQAADADLTSWAGVTRASGFDTFTATPSGANLGALLTSALTVAKGGTGLTAGTSGGVLYYSASGTLASSAALAANALVVGGGAGVAPSTITTGTGVNTALGTNVGSAGAFARIIAQGTSALNTSSISSGACATVVTTSATGAASTDVIDWVPNASLNAVTGYAPTTNGSLIVRPYPTTNNVNFDVCNNTNGSITPGAVTLNWRILR